tara:strand:- start:242 stop:577 length:336 start_codon:yes stop_codon:yes gene_type:complete
MTNQINLKITLEKTDVKTYTVDYTIDMDDLIKFVDDNHGSYQKMEVDPTLDPETYGDLKVTCTQDEYYNHHVDNYIDNQDPDLIFTDNCHDHDKCEFVSEECSILRTYAAD